MKRLTTVLGAILIAAFVTPLSANAQARGSGPPPTVGPEAEAVHGKLFPHGQAGEIPDRLARSTGDIHLEGPAVTDYAIQLPPVDQILNESCGRDLIVVVTAGSAVSHMTANKGYLYSDWGFTVNQVFKNNPKAPIAEGTVITIVRPGGSMRLEGRTIHASQRTFHEFISGTQYLLFLTFVPETRAYSLGSPQGFEFKDGHAALLGFNSSLSRLAGTEKSALLQITSQAMEQLSKFPNGDCPRPK